MELEPSVRYLAPTFEKFTQELCSARLEAGKGGSTMRPEGKHPSDPVKHDSGEHRAESPAVSVDRSAEAEQEHKKCERELAAEIERLNGMVARHRAELEAKVEECADTGSLAAETFTENLEDGEELVHADLAEAVAIAIRSLSKTGSLDKLLNQARLEEAKLWSKSVVPKANHAWAHDRIIALESTLSPPDSAAGEKTTGAR
jgi:hypothetical protein